MQRRVGPWTLVGALALAPPAAAQSVQNVVLRNSFNPIGAGARGLGMGGAFIAVADDGTAASFNPAGLAQLRRTELALVGFHKRLDSELSFTRLDETPGSQKSRSDDTRLDFAGLAIPFQVAERTLTVQLSYQRSVDLFGEGTAVTQDNFPLEDLGLRPGDLGLPPSTRQASLVADIQARQAGALHTASLAAAYQATPRLSLGLAVNYVFGDWTAEGDLTARLQVLPGPGPGGRALPPVELFRSDREFSQAQGTSGVALDTGFLLKYPRLSLGGVLRLPFSPAYDLSERDRFSDTVFGRTLPAEPYSVDLTSRMQWPLSAGVGLAVRPFRGLTLAADYTRTRWSRASLENVPQGALLTPLPDLDPESGERAEPTYADLNFFDLLPASQTGTRDTSQWRLGGEYLIVLSKLIIPLRGGWFRDRSPVPQVTSQEPREIDGWTAGTGLNLSRFVVDVAFEQRESSGPIGLIFRGGQQQAQSRAPQESVRQRRLVASLIYRFGSTDDPFKRLFRSLFVGGGDGAAH